MVLYDWRELEKKCPIDITRLREHITLIEKAIKMKISESSIEKSKENLIMAASELDIVFSKLLSALYNYEVLEKDTDRRLFAILKEDVGGFGGIIDERQNSLVEIYDSPTKTGIARIAAFKRILKSALYGCIWNSLDMASEEYNKVEDPNKTLGGFLRIFFLVLSMNMSVFGGPTRRRALGLPGITGIGGKTLSTPPSWNILIGKKTDNLINKEYKERFGEDISFEEMEHEEDLGGYKDDLESVE